MMRKTHHIVRIAETRLRSRERSLENFFLFGGVLVFLLDVVYMCVLCLCVYFWVFFCWFLVFLVFKKNFVPEMATRESELRELLCGDAVQ